MKVKLDVAIQAVPKRRAFVERQVQELPEARPYYDNVMAGAWWSCKAILERSIADGYTHCLMLQDDVWPCKDLPEAITEAATYWGQQPFSLFAPNYHVELRYSKHNRTYLATVGRQKFLKIDWYPNQSVCYPLELAQDFIDWIETRQLDEKFWKDASKTMSRNHQEDHRWWKFLIARKIARIGTVPSLVEHLGFDHSTIPGVPSPRKALSYIGAQVSALDDWWNLDIPIGYERKSK